MDCMVARRTWAALVTVFLLSLSMATAACDAQCALRLAATPEQTTMETVAQSHCGSVATSGYADDRGVQAFSSCGHRACADTANLLVPKVRITPQVNEVTVTMVAHAQVGVALASATHFATHSRFLTAPGALSASLRI